MKRTRVIAVTFAVLVTIVARAEQRGIKLPVTLTVKGNSQPFFVSATSVMNADGKVDWARFTDENVRTILQAEASRITRGATESAARPGETAPCDTRTITFGLGTRQGSVKKLIAHAEAVYRGRIVATTPGFLLATPVTLLAIEITSSFQSDAGYPSTGLVYVTWPGADFRVGGSRFCNGGSSSGFVPSIGDEILVLAQSPSNDTTETYLATTEEQLFVSHNGRVIVPESLAHDTGLPKPLTIQGLERMATEGRLAKTDRRPR